MSLTCIEHRFLLKISTLDNIKGKSVLNACEADCMLAIITLIYSQVSGGEREREREEKRDEGEYVF